MSIVTTLKAKDNNEVEQNVYPRTTIDAVAQEDGKSLTTILNEINSKIDNQDGSAGVVLPVNPTAEEINSMPVGSMYLII